jgi:HSP20 family protein
MMSVHAMTRFPRTVELRDGGCATLLPMTAADADITVAGDGGLLTLTGHCKEEKEIKEARDYVAERFAGSFTRSFALPDEVDAKGITAEYKDGVLEIRALMPDTAKADPVKIAVKG